MLYIVGHICRALLSTTYLQMWTQSKRPLQSFCWCVVSLQELKPVSFKLISTERPRNSAGNVTKARTKMENLRKIRWPFLHTQPFLPNKGYHKNCFLRFPVFIGISLIIIMLLIRLGVITIFGRTRLARQRSLSAAMLTLACRLSTDLNEANSESASRKGPDINNL
jgi:hypothetical protein